MLNSYDSTEGRKLWFMDTAEVGAAGGQKLKKLVTAKKAQATALFLKPMDFGSLNGP